MRGAGIYLVIFVTAKPCWVSFTNNVTPTVARNITTRNWSILCYVDGNFLRHNSWFDDSCLWMFSSTFEQCWWLNLESIYSLKDAINNSVHIKSVSQIFLEFSLLFDLGRNTLFLFLLSQLIKLNYTEVKFVQVINVRVLFFEPFHKVTSKIKFVEFIFHPNGSDWLRPIISKLFFIWG